MRGVAHDVQVHNVRGDTDEKTMCVCVHVCACVCVREHVIKHTRKVDEIPQANLP